MVPDISLGQRVRIKLNGARGEVRGICDRVGIGRQYEVEYVDASNALHMVWLTDDQFEALSDATNVAEQQPANAG